MMEIQNYEEQGKGGPVVATFDFTIPALGFTCRRWKLMKSKKGGLFVVSPSFAKEDSSGDKTWHKYVEVSEKRSRDFQRAVLDALKPFTKEESPGF
jgi:hypothetical protein